MQFCLTDEVFAVNCLTSLLTKGSLQHVNPTSVGEEGRERERERAIHISRQSINRANEEKDVTQLGGGERERGRASRKHGSGSRFMVHSLLIISSHLPARARARRAMHT